MTRPCSRKVHAQQEILKSRLRPQIIPMRKDFCPHQRRATLLIGMVEFLEHPLISETAVDERFRHRRHIPLLGKFFHFAEHA